MGGLAKNMGGYAKHAFYSVLINCAIFRSVRQNQYTRKTVSREKRVSSVLVFAIHTSIFNNVILRA